MGSDLTEINMVSEASFDDPMEMGEGSHHHRATGRGLRRHSKSRTGSKKAVAIKKPSKAQERAEKQLQKALEKQVEKGLKAAEKPNTLVFRGQ